MHDYIRFTFTSTAPFKTPSIRFLTWQNKIFMKGMFESSNVTSWRFVLTNILCFLNGSSHFLKLTYFQQFHLNKRKVININPNYFPFSISTSLLQVQSNTTTILHHLNQLTNYNKFKVKLNNIENRFLHSTI